MFAQGNKSNLILLFCLGALLLAACSGSTVIDFNVDPGTGMGNIIVTGDEASQPTAANPDNMQILVFGILAALLLATVAIFMASARRDPR